MDTSRINALDFLQILHGTLRHDNSEAETARAAKCIEYVIEHAATLKKILLPSEKQLLQGVCDYRAAHNIAPDRELVGTFIKAMRRHELLLETLGKYDTFEDELKAVTDRDLGLYIERRRDNYRRVRMAAGFRTAMEIASGAVAGEKKGETLSGPEDAARYARRFIQEDAALAPNTQPLGGDWAENADHIEASLLAALETPEQRRILTGYQKIDEQIVIGPTEEIRFVGILGYTNHGKSSFMLPMIYNMCRAGKKILLVPREHSVEATWHRLTFMHAEFFPKLAVPSYSYWKRKPHLITEEHKRNLKIILDDLRERKSIAGSIQVVHASTWPQIIERLQQSEEPFDVLGIDYLSHLETSNSENHVEEIKGVIRQAQALTKDYKNGRGLVIISPFQANREGMRRADEREFEAWGDYTADTAALEWFSQASQDVDLLIGVWQKDWLRANGQMKISCVKARAGQFFEPHYVKVDRRTRYIRDVHLAQNEIGRIKEQPNTEDGSRTAVVVPIREKKPLTGVPGLVDDDTSDLDYPIVSARAQQKQPEVANA
ncbi:MAG TPA: hypothetical protein VHU83_06770 [Bryobacteraceae bacterium]|nr:hypothetical protein [Bryobacteraceae bacterium]